MPLVDLPIEKLLQYEGRNPRPADFDAYWDRARAELNDFISRENFSAAFNTQPVDFQVPSARFQEITFPSLGGAQIAAKLAVPTWKAGPHPFVVYFHGYAWRSPDWATLAAWTAAGFAVLAPDVRGQGGKSTDPGGHQGNTLKGHIIRGLDDHPDRLFFRNAFLDTALAAHIASIHPVADTSKIFAHGASQGGGLTLACAALANDKIAACAPVYPFLSDYKRVWEMDLASGAYEELKTFFRIQDPLHERENEVFEKLGYIDVQHLAPSIKCPTLMATGLMDTTCPPSTQFAAYNKVAGPKSLVTYPDFGHDGLPGLTERVMNFFWQH